MTTETYAKATLRQRAEHELKELAIISAYLYVTLGAVILMKTAVLHTEGIAFAPLGIAIVKAVVLGKFVLLGNLLHVGGRDISGPLIWPTLPTDGPQTVLSRRDPATGAGFALVATPDGMIELDLHHNLFAGFSHRMPLLTVKSARLVNNFVYGWTYYPMRGKGERHNFQTMTRAES